MSLIYNRIASQNGIIRNWLEVKYSTGITYANNNRIEWPISNESVERKKSTSQIIYKHQTQYRKEAARIWPLIFSRFNGIVGKINRIYVPIRELFLQRHFQWRFFLLVSKAVPFKRRELKQFSALKVTMNIEEELNEQKKATKTQLLSVCS